MRARTLYSFVVHTWGSQQRAVHAMIERIPISTSRNRGRFINYRGAGVYRKRLLHAFSISLSGWMISSHVAQPFIYYILTSIHDWSMFALRKCGSHSFRSISFERSHSDRFWLRSISDWSRSRVLLTCIVKRLLRPCQQRRSSWSCFGCGYTFSIRPKINYPFHKHSFLANLIVQSDQI